MNQQQLDRIAAALTGNAGSNASAAHIAEQVLASCAGVEQALFPIIGLRGVSALYWRALHLTRGTHPWLPNHVEGFESVIDLAPLKAALLLQSHADATHGGAVLLGNYHDLLASLVGAPLTERLLRSVWVAFLTDPSPQDSSP